MNLTEVILKVSLFIVFYTFLGYGILLYLLVFMKRFSKRVDTQLTVDFEPYLTLVIPCFNEEDILEKKIANSLALDYPSHKLSILFITDGSTDGSSEVLAKYPDISVLHKDRRAGKAAAENRAMQFVKTPIVIFSDANAMLNKEAIGYMVKHFADAKTGCVSGEKRIETDISNNASTAGEGIYWKYESLLKKWDAELNSSVGAAGELVAFRSALFEALPEDTLVDDFMQSMQIAAKGYRIVYEPKAFAVETASLNVKEELKRKIRISAGNWQAIKRLSGKLRFSKTPVLFFQYISHKVLRWAVAPFLLILIFFLTISLAINGGLFYQVLLYIQSVFYLIAVAGYLFEHTHTRLTVFFIPYYFCVMNYAAIAGLVKLLSGQQTANWEKAKRTP
jgi:cellulose synthase/poly-beta-1,6-N-acetylglucosamine synthase-like glycosyltransferase